MTANGATFHKSVLNVNGFTVVYPNVGDAQDIVETFPPDPYAISSTQLFPLGTKLIRGEQIWRYALNGGAALVPGYTCQTAASSSAGHDMDMVTAAADVGDFAITITPVTAAITKDLYKEGYLWTNDLAGEGQCLKVKTCPAITHTQTGVITTYDPVTLALTASTLTGIRRNPYSGVVVTPDTTLTGAVIGACDIPVTLAYYFWLQTGGPIAIHTINNVTIGSPVTGLTSTGTVDGCVGPLTSSGTNEVVIGYVLCVGVSTDKSLIFLTLDR